MEYSPMYWEAREASLAFYDSAPSTLKASNWAHYLVMSDPSITFPRLERLRRAQGFIGKGALHRFEEEVLKPRVMQLEIDCVTARLAQSAIDDVVEHLLLGVRLFEGGL